MANRKSNSLDREWELKRIATRLGRLKVNRRFSDRNRRVFGESQEILLEQIKRLEQGLERPGI